MKKKEYIQSIAEQFIECYFISFNNIYVSREYMFFGAN